MFVRVWVSVVPTKAPLGFVLPVSTPLVRIPTPFTVENVPVFPPVPLATTTCWSALVVVFVEKSPPVPAPGQVENDPSPRKQSEPLPLSLGNRPCAPAVAFAVVTSLNESFVSVIAGMSAKTRPRNVGAASDPVVGPLKTVLAV